EREHLIRAKAAELATAGATTVREESYGEHLDHVVMHDPEGNEFCVAWWCEQEKLRRPVCRAGFTLNA
ncbi:MAG: hypothetical protein JWP07_1920, partial [Pseudonocardiales bacterium]|nr:hypothetical protein [Pseudonocardiales bacterium]